jgi:PKD repeat protein
MNNKITIAILSILTIFFLTAQSCNFGGISSGLAAECVGEGDIVCDDTEAYQCQLASYGVGYYVSRASGYDSSDCGAEEEVDSDTLERLLISISSDIEAAVDDLQSIKLRAAKAKTDEDGRALQMMKLEVAEIRTTLRDINDVLDGIASDIITADEAGEDVTEVEVLYDTAVTDLSAAETLLGVVQTQIADALEALRGSGTSSLVSASCSVSTTTAAVGETITFDGSGSYSASSYSWDFDDDGAEDSTSDSDTYSYSAAGTYTAALTVTASDGTTDSVSCDSVTVSTTDETDTDGDGWTDAEEAEAGTDPNDSQDSPTCTDSDRDADTSSFLDVTEKGTTTGYSDASDTTSTTRTDSCVSTSVLVETYCWNGYNTGSSSYNCIAHGYSGCSDDVCYSSSTVTSYDATDVTGVSTTASESTRLYFWSYEKVSVGSFTGMGYFSGTTYTDLTGNPSAASPLLIGSTAAYWTGLTAATLSVTTDTGSIAVTLPSMSSSARVDTYMLFYIAEDGSLYYADSGNDGVKSDRSDLLAPEDALTAAHLVS